MPREELESTVLFDITTDKGHIILGLRTTSLSSLHEIEQAKGLNTQFIIDKLKLRLEQRQSYSLD